MKIFRKGIMKWVIGAALLLVLAFFGFTAEVREGECAVITRFGAVRTEVSEAGLYFRLPWPFENVVKYDVRNQYTESSYLETLTKNQNNIILQSYAVWNVSEPLKYHNAVGDNAVAELRLNELIVNASNSVLGKYELENVVSNDPAKLKLNDIEGEIFENVKLHAAERYGITVEEVGIMKLSMPESNLSGMFEKMSQERQTEIEKISAAGQKAASEITYKAEADASETIAEGQQQAAAIDAETEKKVAAIYAEAQASNMELFKFLLELDTVVNSVNGDTTLIVKKGEFLEGLFSEELIEMVKEAQAKNQALNSGE